MHLSSYLKCRFFIEHYFSGKSGLKILEVGSKNYEGQRSNRDLIPSSWEYVGLDIEAGQNVDLVPTNPFSWEEIPDNSYDIVISSQTFEHNPFFWVTMADIARVLKEGGYVFIVAPAAGIVHRYPIDCWRFYPDAWPVLCAYSGLELRESYDETARPGKDVEGSEWKDSAMIARKPNFSSDAERSVNSARLQGILHSQPKCSTFTSPDRNSNLQAFQKYENSFRGNSFKNILGKIWRALHPCIIYRRTFIDS